MKTIALICCIITIAASNTIIGGAHASAPHLSDNNSPRNLAGEDAWLRRHLQEYNMKIARCGNESDIVDVTVRNGGKTVEPGSMKSIEWAISNNRAMNYVPGTDGKLLPSLYSYPDGCFNRVVAFGLIKYNAKRQAAQAELDQHIAAWTAKSVPQYSYKRSVKCFCDASVLSEKLISVRLERVDLYDLELGKAVPADGMPLKVDELFARAQTAIDYGTEESIVLKYDPEYSIPTVISYSGDATDTSLHITIRDFSNKPHDIETPQQKNIALYIIVPIVCTLVGLAGFMGAVYVILMKKDWIRGKLGLPNRKMVFDLNDLSNPRRLPEAPTGHQDQQGYGGNRNDNKNGKGGTVFDDDDDEEMKENPNGKGFDRI
eukprot:PhM_4_TR18603/c0_g1_i1/m.30869